MYTLLEDRSPRTCPRHPTNEGNAAPNGIIGFEGLAPVSRAVRGSQLGQELHEVALRPEALAKLFKVAGERLLLVDGSQEIADGENELGGLGIRRVVRLSHEIRDGVLVDANGVVRVVGLAVAGERDPLVDRAAEVPCLLPRSVGVALPQEDVDETRMPAHRTRPPFAVVARVASSSTIGAQSIHRSLTPGGPCIHSLCLRLQPLVRLEVPGVVREVLSDHVKGVVLAPQLAVDVSEKGEQTGIGAIREGSVAALCPVDRVFDPPRIS